MPPYIQYNNFIHNALCKITFTRNLAGAGTARKKDVCPLYNFYAWIPVACMTAPPGEGASIGSVKNNS